MTAPLHSRPFMLEHARVGAPYACKDGSKATILKWDLRGTNPLTGFIESDSETDLVCRWDEEGTTYGGASKHGNLVMLPLGYIDGKPVFVGDEVETNSLSIDGSWETVAVKPGDHGFTTCRWPAPTKMYPTLTRSDIDMLKDWCGPDWQVNFANAALRHAIDAGQVVLPEPPVMRCTLNTDPGEIAYWNFDARKKGYAEWNGRPQSERDAFKAEYYRAINAYRAARDMAIAEAVRKACFYASTEAHVTRRHLNKIDLAAIIAGVAP